MPCLLSAFFVLRVTDQSLSSALPFTTSLGNVSSALSGRALVVDLENMYTVSLGGRRSEQKGGEELHLEGILRGSSEAPSERSNPLYSLDLRLSPIHLSLVGKRIA